MIVAQWTNEERTKSVTLNADNTISYIERDHPSHIWSPPFTLKLESYHNSLTDVFAHLREMRHANVKLDFTDADSEDRSVKGRTLDSRTDVGE